MDVPSAENLTERQRFLLSVLVREYITHPEPISSGRLTAAANLNISSATARNEMAALEEKGYIRSPHTSSGRVPTEEGYRFFAKQLLEDVTLPPPPVEMIRSQFQDVPQEVDAWLQTATVILAQQTHAAAIVTEPRIYTSHRFKHIQLIGVQGRLVLMVLVLNSGYVHQQMLVMAEPIPQPQLSQASDVLNRIAIDQTANDVRDACRNATTLVQEIGDLAADALQQLDDLGGRIRYQAGLSELLPELKEQSAKQALRVLEGHVGLDPILGEMADKEVGTVRVVIAGEGRWEELSHLSMVLGRYGTGSMMGAIGVVGPTRMSYPKAIASVGYLAEYISEFLSEAQGNAAEARDEDSDAEGE
ncbi:MAG: heat-inducible transcription repressor HrcA [Anaerolineales bacterium]|nr:heat-inducible transcription repressor HrcA [Anaerolineales bacterium]